MSNELTILLNPDSVDNNKNILSYLNKNQQKINNNNIFIKPVPVTHDKIDKFVKIGVNNLPSLLYIHKIVYGVNEMKKFINELCQEPISREKETKSSYDTDDINEYLKNIAMDDDNTELEETVTTEEIQNNRFTQKNTINFNDDEVSTTHKGPTNRDDDLMDKFYANLEETV